ncbi:hypothetical protein AYR66_13885 [Noviherbaspirillum denitrificans]|uniref:Uncharacterized protein n=1 Tax=Noviherbaspirillum denitrificans TaxID=1968433 RepID=A0A254TGI8_9BURK|nr:hypothetical protein AYR66_13885 [Noviherbaspirillum denitrificans]
MPEPIGFIGPHPVDHIAAIFGNRMKQVVHHARLGTMLLHFQVEGRVHVHGHRSPKRNFLEHCLAAN